MVHLRDKFPSDVLPFQGVGPGLVTVVQVKVVHGPDHKVPKQTCKQYTRLL